MTIIPEVEPKLASPPNDMPQLKQTLLQMASDGHTTCRETFDTYYDTAEDKLRRDGLLLRVCEQNHGHVQRVSTKADRRMKPVTPGEWEDVIEGAETDRGCGRTPPAPAGSIH